MPRTFAKGSSWLAFLVCVSWACTPAASPSGDLTPLVVVDRAPNAPARVRPPGASQQVWIEPRSPNDLTAYVSLGSLLDVGTDDFTITHWYRTSFRQPRRLGDVLGNRQDSSGGNFFSVRMHGEGVLSVELDDDEQGTNYVAIDTGAMHVNDDQWHHFAYARRGSELRLYVDGRLIAAGSTRSGEPTRLASGRDFRLGRSLPAGGTFTSLPGAYALVRLVGRALNDDEVRADYAAGARSMASATAAAAAVDSRPLAPARESAPEVGYRESCAGCVYDGERGVLMCAACKDRAGYLHATTLVVGSSRGSVCNEDGALRFCAGN